MACSESARCPHVLAAAARRWCVATPTRTPHTDGELHAGAVLVGLHRGKKAAPCCRLEEDGDRGTTAGRRGLDATTARPISGGSVLDLLPATNVGAANAHSQRGGLLRGSGVEAFKRWRVQGCRRAGVQACRRSKRPKRPRACSAGGVQQQRCQR